MFLYLQPVGLTITNCQLSKTTRSRCCGIINHPDIVVLKKDQWIVFLEIACPADVNVLDKEDKKVLKYQGPYCI